MLNKNHGIPVLDDIKNAHERIQTFVHRTPVLKASSINDITQADIQFKCENFQKVGAFKYRGATNAVLSLRSDELKAGVATHSSGNHAAALALAAKQCKIPAYIVMPENSPEIKKKAVKGYGGIISYCESTLEARESKLNEVLKNTGATFIHPYNRKEIIAGAGTAALEFLQQSPDLNSLITPVGGGGLLSGSAICAKALYPGIQVFGAEPKGADDAYRSLLAGKIIPSVNPDTIADGLLTSLGDLTFKAISQNVDAIFTVTESAIIEAMRLLWERMKIIVEPSAAVGLAVVLEHKEVFKNKKIGIILSGGNLDLGNLPF